MRSRMCPTEACTSYPSPRYCAMVLAFAGDSTITSFLVPGTSPLPSVAHHTQSYTESARTATAAHRGGPARELASTGMPANDPITVTDTTRPRVLHAFRRVPFAVATPA